MNRQTLRQSQDAASAINVLGAIIGALENGTTRGFDATAQKIIALCKAESQRQLKKMDAADAKLGYPYPKR